MNEMLNFLLSPLGLPIHALWQYLILAGLAYMAFFSGWDGQPGSPLGTLAHGALRFGAFFLLWAACFGAVAAVTWLIAHWVLGIVSLVGVLLLTLALVAGCGRRAEPVCWAAP